MNESNKVIVFQMDEQQYGIDIQDVLSIEKLQTITEVPKTSVFIKGVINLRGEIIPVIDLKERLELGETTRNEQTRILIVKIDDIQVGLMVDAATDVTDIDATIIEPVPKVINGVHETFLQGVAKLDDTLLVLIDLVHILNFEEINEVKEVIEE